MHLLPLAVAVLHEELDLVRGALQLQLQPLNHSLLIGNLLRLWIHVDRWSIVDFACSRCVVQSRDVLVGVDVTGRQAGDHQRETVPAQALPQDRRQLRLAVGDVLCYLGRAVPAQFTLERVLPHAQAPARILRQSRDHLPQGEETLVDSNSFSELGLVDGGFGALDKI